MSPRIKPLAVFADCRCEVGTTDAPLLVARVADGDHAHEKAPGPNPGLFRLLTSGSRCSRSRPAEPRHQWPDRSRGCSTDPRKTGSCTPQRGLPRSAAPGCCGTG